MRKKFAGCAIFVFIYIVMFAVGMVAVQDVYAAENQRVVQINIDGNLLQAPPVGDMPPVLMGGRTLVPVRHVFEAMGAVVDFQEAMERVVILHEGNLILMHIGEYSFFFNNDNHTMDVAPQLINGRTMVPVSFVAGLMGFDVRWDDATSTVFLTNQNASELSLSDLSDVSVDNSTIIPSETNLQTNITSVTWNEARTQFTISAETAITMVDWHMLADGRLVVDIFNAQTALAQSNFTINNSFLTTVRTGLNIIDGNYVARVVFDLTRAMTYRITMSEDRRHIVVTFELNEISAVHHINRFVQNESESVIITGVTAPITDIFLLGNPLRLVVDIPHARLSENAVLTDNNMPKWLVSDVRMAQFDPMAVRVVLDLNENISFTVEENAENGSVTINVGLPTHRNIYLNSQNGTIMLMRPQDLGIGDILQFDQYHQRRYSFILPSDFSEHFGYGDFWIRDGIINHIEIVTENGITQIIFDTAVIRSYIIEETPDAILIRPVDPREKYDFVVVIDPGHGGRDPGAVHHGHHESDLVLDIALMVIDMLNRDGLVKVYTTRYTDVAVTNTERARIGNEAGDIFISIHLNAANGVANGVETLYFVHNAEPSDFNSRHLAEIIQSNMVEDIGFNYRRLWNRPLLLVLNSTRIPAALVEVGFMDAMVDAQRLHQQEYRYRAAQSIVRSIYEAREIIGR
ncbi:MAG: N-acetylmuramoyl-L-alanine amidase family protein [Defluviitaleaceae bacterium]|nr:N-acetylmuramoyl-L-alanine amidase family protein [Defluviitaleaceae bacterium]